MCIEIIISKDFFFLDRLFRMPEYIKDYNFYYYTDGL